MARVKNRIDPRAHDGHGTNTEPMMTGHGAPASASGRGNEAMPRGKLVNNNWGSKSLKKLQTTGGSSAVGSDRFVRPIDATTANIPGANLGNPTGDRSLD